MKKYMVAGILLIAVITLGVVLKLDRTKSIPVPEDAVVSQESTQKRTPSAYDLTEDSDFYTVVSEYTVPYELDALVEESTLIVLGTVEEESAPFLIQGVSGLGELAYTDYSVNVSDIVRGNTESGGQITVRQEGNPHLTSVVYEDAPILEVGKEYIFFLQKPGMGGGFNTEGDYYYILGSRQGLYEEYSDVAPLNGEGDEEKIYVSQQKLLRNGSIDAGVLTIQRNAVDEDLEDMVEKNDGALSWHAFYDTVQEKNIACPVDENAKRKEIEQNYKANLDNGIITEEAYRQAMDDLDQYAQIVPLEPAAASEKAVGTDMRVFIS